jgi:uncharacterized protein (TIGR02145 family)
MKKLAALSTLFIIMLIAACGSSSNDGQDAQQGVSITATQHTAWEDSEDYLEFVIDLGSPNGTTESIFVFFEASGSGLERDDLLFSTSLQQEYVEIPSGSQTASIKIEGFAANGIVEETQPIKLRLTGCSSAEYPIGPSSEATAIIMDGDGPIVTDIDGNTYRTVLIGSQTWIAKNLITSRFRNGDPIYGSWSYNNDPDYWKIYGCLYSWHSVMDIRGLAPEGWHIPTYQDWIELTDYLGGEEVAGGKLKAVTLWESPNKGATNESGFTALPGGLRDLRGNFKDAGKNGYFWSASEINLDNAGLLWLFNNTSEAYQSGLNKNLGFSVRCVKD